MSGREQELRERAARHGQEHVFRFWERLDEAGRERLLGQVAALDLELVDRLGELLRRPAAEGPAPALEPPELFTLDAAARGDAAVASARAAGERALSEGRVGYVLVAGGQASRLGYDMPKGCFPVGPVSGRSLFELHARRLLAARERHGAPVTWYVMTSPANDAATRAFFEENAHFGLDPDDVRFFSQAMLPALDLEGRILLAAPGGLFLAPNGHGGVLAALATAGCLAHARERGIETLSYFQVDNPLVRPADALFLGLHREAGAQMSSKVVAKRDAAEKVGVIGRVDGSLGCIEYSDLPEELRESRDAEGRLRFRAGNIAVHALERAFVEELTEGGLQLPWHVARKRMKVLDERGELVEREGAKFESFVFDALGRAERSVTMEVDRAVEFSPVKNAEGQDSPASARADLCRLHAGWAEAGGVDLPAPDEHGVVPVEVDPLFAEDEAAFRARMPAAPVEKDAGLLFE